jgi:hypothetical protein
MHCSIPSRPLGCAKLPRSRYTTHEAQPRLPHNDFTSQVIKLWVVAGHENTGDFKYGLSDRHSEIFYSYG